MGRDFRSPASLVLFAIVSLTAAAAIEHSGIELAVRELGFPMPSQAQVDLAMRPWSGDEGFFGDVSIEAWYLANSWFLVSDHFFEGGLGATATLVDSRRFELSAGAGTAFSLDSGQVAVPGVVGLSLSWEPWRWLRLSLRTLGLLYSDGIIVNPQLSATVATPLQGVGMIATFNGSYAGLFDRSKTAFAYTLGYGIVLGLREARP